MTEIGCAINNHSTVEGINPYADSLIEILKKAQARITELEKDAARLRFAFSTEKHGSMAIYELHARILFGDEPSMDDVRKAIDTAMQGA